MKIKFENHFYVVFIIRENKKKCFIIFSCFKINHKKIEKSKFSDFSNRDHFLKLWRITPVEKKMRF